MTKGCDYMKHYKKNFKIYNLLFLICISLFLSACSGNSTTNTETNNTTSETEKIVTSTKTLPQQYEVIINNIINSYPWNDDELTMVAENPDLTFMYRKSSSLSDVGFALIDLDNNGQEELIITDVNRPFIYDLYTISDGKAIHLFDSGERYCYYIYENGYIKNQWSGSAATNGNDFYKLENGTLIFIERITMDEYHALDIGLIKDISEADGNHFFKSKTTSVEDYKAITLEEYKNILESYENTNKLLEIEYTLLSEY